MHAASVNPQQRLRPLREQEKEEESLLNARQKCNQVPLAAVIRGVIRVARQNQGFFFIRSVGPSVRPRMIDVASNLEFLPFRL